MVVYFKVFFYFYNVLLMNLRDRELLFVDKYVIIFEKLIFKIKL